MPNEPVRRYEFDLYRGDVERRLGNLERWREAHETEHDEDEEDRVKEAKERRRWSWSQVVAVVSAGILLATLWVQAAAAK